jgi:transcriptional regulator GlxA family with amidase domain
MCANTAKRRIGIIGYDGVQALDVIGPSDAFSMAAEFSGGQEGAEYDVAVLGLSRKPFVAESGVQIKPDHVLEHAPEMDTVIVPGGRSLRLVPQTAARISNWLKDRAPRIRRMVSVCTGIYGVAPSGLLDGRKVTTHWRFARDVAQRFPSLKLETNAIFIKDGPFYTSAGVTAGIDLALAMIEEDHGPAVSLSIAREMVVYLKRPGGQEQYSEPLQYQMTSGKSFADLIPWMRGHMQQDLSIEALAARSNLSVRQFSRKFKQEFGVAPGTFVENLRLDEARKRLSEHSTRVEAIASSIGFASGDSFRRAFERRFGLAPSRFRGRFQGT